jgi:hypothetical protein
MASSVFLTGIPRAYQPTGRERKPHPENVDGEIPVYTKNRN